VPNTAKRQPRDIAAPLAFDHYHAMSSAFRWAVPKRFNMAQWCATRWAQLPDASARVAVISQASSAEGQAGLGATTLHTYAQLYAQASQLAHG
jgi:acetyl-CoA synthetase